MKATRWAVIAAAVLAAACGGDGDGGTGPGNNNPGFSANVTGDVQTTFSGAAAFGTVVDPDFGPAFAVEMSENDPTGGGVIQLFRIGNGTPAAGTYPIADALNGNPGQGDWVAVAYDTDQGQLTAVFVATGGTVKVTSVTNGVAKGTFSFNAEGGWFDDPGTTISIKITGQFNAGAIGGGDIRQLQKSRR